MPLIFFQHDSLLAGFLKGLELWNGITTPYASAIIIELHETPSTDQKDSVRFIRLYYKNDTETKPMAEPIAWTFQGKYNYHPIGLVVVVVLVVVFCIHVYGTFAMFLCVLLIC